MTLEKGKRKFREKEAVRATTTKIFFSIQHYNEDGSYQEFEKYDACTENIQKLILWKKYSITSNKETRPPSSG